MDNLEKNTVVQFAGELIACPSITPDRSKAQAIIAQRLEPLGFKIVPLEKNGVKSLWAEFGTTGPKNSAPLLVFSGHTDVVPPGEENLWSSPPFEPTIRSEKLYGRGAADMKGNIASAVIAIEKLIQTQKKIPFRIGVAIAGDEEGDLNHGTSDLLQMLQEQGTKIDYCIVCEPSSVTAVGDTIKVGRRGSLTGKLRINGVQGHAAYPTLAKNAFHIALKPLEELCAREWDRGSEGFSPTTFQITNVMAGTGAANVIPGSCEVTFNFRFQPELTPESIQNVVREVFDRYQLNYEISWLLGAKPFLAKNGKLVSLVQEVIKNELNISPQLSTGGGTSDARFFAEIGIEVVELGLLSHSIHQIDEHVKLSDLETLTTVYHKILECFSEANQD